MSFQQSSPILGGGGPKLKHSKQITIYASLIQRINRNKVLRLLGVRDKCQENVHQLVTASKGSFSYLMINDYPRRRTSSSIWMENGPLHFKLFKLQFWRSLLSVYSYHLHLKRPRQWLIIEYIVGKIHLKFYLIPYRILYDVLMTIKLQ